MGDFHTQKKRVQRRPSLSSEWRDVVPMSAYHPLLGKFWLFDKHVTYNSFPNYYPFILWDELITLLLFTPKQVLEEQFRRESIVWKIFTFFNKPSVHADSVQSNEIRSFNVAQLTNERMRNANWTSSNIRSGWENVLI